jgi:hypothetical protein
VVALFFAPDAAKGLTPLHQAWRLLSGFSVSGSFKGGRLLSQVPELPLCVLALFSDPDGFARITVT